MKDKEEIQREIRRLQTEIDQITEEKNDLEVQFHINELFDNTDEDYEVLDAVERKIGDMYIQILNIIGVDVVDDNYEYLNEHIWNIRDDVLSAIKNDSGVFKLRKEDWIEN